MKKAKTGSSVDVHYVGTFEDGTKFDSSIDRGETLTFEVGSGQVIRGFDSAVVGMSPGEKTTVSLTPDEAYGDRREEAVQEFPLSAFSDEMRSTLTEGVTIMGQNEAGQQMMGKILSLEKTTAVIDFNHPLAGKNLNFEIELVDIK